MAKVDKKYVEGRLNSIKMCLIGSLQEEIKGRMKKFGSWNKGYIKAGDYVHDHYKGPDNHRSVECIGEHITYVQSMLEKVKVHKDDFSYNQRLLQEQHDRELAIEQEAIKLLDEIMLGIHKVEDIPSLLENFKKMEV